MRLRRKSRRQEVVSRRQVRQEQGAKADNTDAQIKANRDRAAELRQWAKDHGYRDRGIDEL